MNKSRGFSLTELVITVIIVGILALIAMFVYKILIMRAVATEGKALMGAIGRAEKTYWVENGTFYGYKTPNKPDGMSDEEYENIYKPQQQEQALADDGPWHFRSYDEVLGIDARGNKYFTSFSFNEGDDEALYATAQSDKPYNGFQCILIIDLRDVGGDIEKATTKIRLVDTGHNLIDETVE